MREAGAIVLAKSNMAEFAFSPYETVSSILPGYTRNPYALDRVTAGSSGGTAAAVSANLGEVGLGTDTGNSIRGPSAHNALVGIRSTMGLTSRAGVVPLNLSADIAGPMARTVADAAAIFQVIVGEDPDDPATAASRGRPREDYSAALRRDGLAAPGSACCTRRTAPPPRTEGCAVFGAALEDLRRAGAVMVDSVGVDSLDAGAGPRAAAASLQVRPQRLARAAGPPWCRTRPTSRRATSCRVMSWHRPREALFGGADGLDVIRRLIPAAAARGAGLLALEVGAGQAAAVADLMRAEFGEVGTLPRPGRRRAGRGRP